MLDERGAAVSLVARQMKLFRNEQALGLWDVGRTNLANTAALGLIVVVAGLSACSNKSNGSVPSPTSTPVYSSTTIMLDQDRHTITGQVNCQTSASQPRATPPESGDLTTRISVHDDAASVSLAVSDEKPPSVDGFAISINGQYQLPYQAPQSPTQVQTTKQGKSYTVTGWGQGTAAGQSGTRQVTFGVHVTCP